ncbi:lyase family protein [Nocardioides aurantiacus]|uniref:3-carboxy-cis,cis-muconate cycloisomerase n=1 Tax=Nocardioides aurantiacus TaxID=86796 RepID=A0A3N2CTG8_9ACTN|nr:lyase family protein [Nocardioides aurantiacus]ROR90805.1 3-carboxy-cis,cis-muconate cycloisomerase [Nocardioides aurantiacus]
MADLLWPGDERAGEVFTDAALLHGLVAVEQAWLDVLVDRGIAPSAARRDLTSLVTSADVTLVASRAESSGNPLVPLLTLLRERGGRPVADPGRWLHRGLTSQDVVDTALVLGARAATRELLGSLDRQVSALATLAERHRDDLMAGRTLTQHAVPLTFGLKAAQWLRGVLDARDALRGLRFPVQVGGAAGTLAAVAEIAGGPDAALATVADVARSLGLEPSPPWHTVRTPFTAYADALVRTTDALGHVANDVLVLARPEVGELAEPAVAGRGGSSTMPQKANPVLSVLVRRAALAAPALGAQLHLAAAEAVDERPDGGWHTEWATLATLSRRTLVAASQAAELLEGLHVDTGAMSALVAQRSSALLAERRSMRELTAPPVGSTRPRPEDDFDPAHYLGATASIIDGVLARAREEN